MLQGKQLREAGRLVEAIQSYSRAISLARNENDAAREARGLILMSAAQVMRFEYSGALASCKLGLEAAERAGSPVLLGSGYNNISSLYVQLGDLESAESAADKAVNNLRLAQDQPQLRGMIASSLANRASIFLFENKVSAANTDYAEALKLALENGNLPLQATIWEARGTSLMREGSIAEAQNAFEKEYLLRQKVSDVDGLAITKEHLAELEIKRPRPNYKVALRLIDEAFATPSISFRTTPQYYPINIRAKILLHSGDRLKALAEFRRAVVSAREWRLGALPGDATNTQTVAALQEVYGDYAHLAAEISLEKHDPALARDAFEILMENRAASLRDQLRLARSRNLQLPDAYYLKLSQFQSAQAQVTLGSNTKEDRLQLQRIRVEVAGYENENGINPGKVRIEKEKNQNRGSLKDIQAKLTRDQVILSISLGRNKSYLWAVTGDEVNLTQIVKEDELEAAASSFSASVRNGVDWQPKANALGKALFGSLPKQVWQKSDWMIVNDGTLLSGVPFSALPDLSSNKNLPLVAGHTLRFLPSASLLLEPRTKATPNEFIGIGDPIYNQADSRFVHNAAADGKTMSLGSSLARLVGSDREVRTAARESHAATVNLLLGPRATRNDLQTAIETPSPALIHFAVHVVSPAGQPQQASLALSLKNGIPELLNPEVIESFRLPGSLVVLSGCSSDQGKPLPGAGLVGLSRAWLVAGASAVMVSSWPTPDDSGQFFSSFYSHLDELKSGSIAQRAALALRQTQLNMLQSGSGYRTSPSFWGAFALISKE